MEYNPRYPQPFTLTQAIALDPEVAWDGLLSGSSSSTTIANPPEISRLRNSLLHLKRTQSELQEYLRDLPPEGDLEVSQAVKENEITIASQDERIFMLRLALTHHGHSVTFDQTPEPTYSPSTPGSAIDRSQNVVGSSSNGLDNIVPPQHTSTGNLETTDVVEPENGVYL